MADEVTIVVDGKPMPAREGEPIAVALVRAGRLVFGRSVKYHRPRGALCFEGNCDGCLMRVDGIPNVMTCCAPAKQGTQVETQNVIGTAKIDLLAATDWFFPEGLDHHHMFTRFAPVNKLMQKVARRIAGVGKLPSRVVEPSTPTTAEVDVLVIGAGTSGIRAANAAAKAGASVMLAEAHDVGGRAALMREEVPALGPPVRVHRGAVVAIFDEAPIGFVQAQDESTRKRWALLDDDDGLLRLAPRAVVIATGRTESVVPVPANDRPGVLTPRAVLRLLDADAIHQWRVVAVGEGRLLDHALSRLRAQGCTVVGPFPPDHVEFEGRPRVKRVRVGDETHGCDAVVVAGPTSAAYPLAHQAGAELGFDGSGFVVRADSEGRTTADNVLAVGSCASTQVDPERAGQRAAQGTRAVAFEPLNKHATTTVPEQDSDKILVCRCEDVTLDAIEEAIERGHRDLESVKRYTGFATGWCQGKQCVAMCARLVVAAGGTSPDHPITPRPPVRPIPLASLGRLIDSSPEMKPAPSTTPSVPLKKSEQELPTHADVVVIGAGIMGLSTAFNLAQLGVENIVVIDKGYLCSGASGRNGGGVRAQWSSATNIRLMKQSLEICDDFATDMRINVWFRRGGYLFLARSEERAQQLAKSVDLQKAHGLTSQLIDAKRCREIVPELDVTNLVAASFNPDDAVVFPWPFVWGYANACKKLGVQVSPFTEALEIETDGSKVKAVVTSRGRVETPLVINAAGAWSPEVAKLVDIAMPNKPHRHEICSTEPLKPFLRPLVAELATGLYCSQSMRGEIVGGVSNEAVPDGLNQGSSMRFLGLYARELTRTMPLLGGVRVLRQWAGCYDITPDGNPIVGRVKALDGFVLLAGFMGHGFMMAPIMGKLTARHLLYGDEEQLFHRWRLERFAEGDLLEETMILG